MGLFAIVLLGMIALVIGSRVVAHRLDLDRVRGVAVSKGWKSINVQWEPFGKGWFFEKGERLYRVHYRDKDGTPHSALCKTSMFTGVNWRDSKY